MYQEVFAVGGFDDGLIEIGVLDDPVEPAVEDGLVGMGFAIAPLVKRSIGYQARPSDLKIVFCKSYKVARL